MREHASAFRSALWLLCCLCSVAQAVVLRDDRGVDVNISRSPQRIVSLLPSLTSTVCA